MTNQSQPLTLKLSNGQEVSIEDTKSVLRHTENGQQRSCAIVRGPAGTAVYNAEGDVQINGAPSSVHWLQLGDTLDFGKGVSAAVEQLGVAEQAIESLLNEDQPSAEIPVREVSVQETPAPVVQAPVVLATIEDDQETFKPATEAARFAPEPQAALMMPQGSAERVTDLSATDLSMAAGFVLPAAAVAASAVTADASVTPNEPVGFTLPTSETPAEPTSDAPSTGFAAELLARIQADDNIEQVVESETIDTLNNESTHSPLAADLLARIQADENNEQFNESETVGTLDSETTHSPLAADGPSFSTPESDSTSISSLIPELPTSSAFTLVDSNNQEDQPDSLETQTGVPVETSTVDSTERQAQSSSVSALLERMKTEGQWGGLSEQEEEEEAATTESHEAPVLDEADEDVQSYMSQLLSRMRDPDDESPQQAPAAAAAPQAAAQPKAEVVEAPKPVGLLKPEEYVPKNKARRLDSLQDMRALANTQTRTAIDRSQAKRREASIGNLNLTIAVASCVAAAVVFLSNIFGSLSFAVAMIAMICGAFYCLKAYFSELLESKKKDDAGTPRQTVDAADEIIEAVEVV